MTDNNFCVIMAGGIGSRFWPLSRTSRPKQFLDKLNTGRTFLQERIICCNKKMKTINKKLYRSNENKVIFGVMGGFGEYLDVDPVLLRVIYIFLSVFTAFFPGVIAYILMAIVVPKKAEKIEEKVNEVN